MSAQVTPSRLELRLEAEIAAAPTMLEADCKRAERAAYLARLGRFDEARRELGALHERYERKRTVVISSWLHLVEGLVAQCSHMSSGAREMFLRSYALSSAANLTSLRALSAAWLAQLDYLQVNVESMVRFVSESLRLSGQDDHATRSRVGLVVAQAYHLAGRFDLARPWYSKVQGHSRAEGDEATLSALMHNMAWLRAQQLRVDSWKHPEEVSDREHALMSAESTANFDLLIGSTSLPALVPILRAQVLTARGQYEDALALYESHMTTGIQDGMNRLQADWLADQSWCRLQLGQTKGALQDAIAAEAAIDQNGQFDDRAMAHGRLAQIFDAFGDHRRSEEHERCATEAWSGHATLQARILELLGQTPEVANWQKSA